MAPAAYLLYARIMEHNPRDPAVARPRPLRARGRPRLDAALRVLHLSRLRPVARRAQALPPVGLADARAIPSATACTSRPASRSPPARSARASPTASAWRWPSASCASTTAREVQDHHIFAIVSDGDLMEGIASEAASLAGHLGLGRSSTSTTTTTSRSTARPTLSFAAEDVDQALRGLRLARRRRSTTPTTSTRSRCAIDQRHARGGAPVADPRAARSSATPSPNKQGTTKAHGTPLGEDEVRATKEMLGWDPDAHFLVPDDVHEHFAQSARGAALQAEWQQRFRAWREAGRRPRRASGTPPGRAARCRASPTRCASIDWGKDKLATRAAGQKAMAAFAAFVPTMVGGAADLSRVDEDRVPRRRRRALHARAPRAQRLLRRARARHGRRRQRHGRPRRHRAPVRLDVPAVRRLHARLDPPVGADRPARRVGLHARLGRASARTARPTSRSSTSPRCARSPGLTVLRPGDAERDRRGLARDPRGPRRPGRARALAPGPARARRRRPGRRRPRRLRAARRRRRATVVLVGTGARGARPRSPPPTCSPRDGVAARVVSMPSWELFAAQDEAYREEVLPRRRCRRSPSRPASRWAGSAGSTARSAIDRFGASAPGAEVLERLGHHAGRRRRRGPRAARAVQRLASSCCRVGAPR